MNKNTVEYNTIRYWVISSCWNGRMPANSPLPTIEEALDTSNDILRSTGPRRALAKKVAKLKHEIICHAAPVASVDATAS